MSSGVQEVVKNNIHLNVEGNEEHWKAFQDGSWEAATFGILDKFISRDDVVVDVGAWIGPITLYVTGKGAHCYSFEPDPVAFSSLSKNVALNPHLASRIQLYNAAITTDGKKIRLYSRHQHGDSGSSILKRIKSSNDFVEVESFTLHEFIATRNPGPISFIKMDVEGAEFFLLPTLVNYFKEHKPTLLISFHLHALMEYYELRLIPIGALRRIYRLLDPGKKVIKKISLRITRRLLNQLSFYTILNENMQIIDISRLNDHDLTQLDMLVFTSHA